MSEEASIVDICIYQVVLPIAIVVGLKTALTALYGYICSLWVDGKPNEWVLILRNGEMKQAAVGLRTFRGPFDQVATFPAKVYKVNFETEQITNERQGVRVSGMLVWTVNRVGDGPFLAYKNLGDISSGNPKTANDSLIAMSSAVVRSCIANSTIQEMITNRKLLRESIHKEMFEVVKGWGVWMETIEITGVTICSSALFKDLQTNYRETMRQEATIHKMQIKSEIEQVEAQNSLEVNCKVNEIDEKERIYVDRVQMEEKEAYEKFLRENAEIMKEKEKLENEQQLFLNTQQQEIKIKLNELKVQHEVAKQEVKMRNEADSQRHKKEVNETAQMILTRNLEDDKILDKSQNEIKLADMQLEKDNMDAMMLRHEAIELAKECYTGKYITKANITNMGGQDASGAILAGVLNKLDVTKTAIGQQE